MREKSELSMHTMLQKFYNYYGISKIMCQLTFVCIKIKYICQEINTIIEWWEWQIYRSKYS